MSVPGPRVNVVAPANRLLLLDGHSLAYRAFYALPAENFSTKTGQNTNAVYGFTSMLINMLRDEEPTHIGVAFDLSRQTFRLEEYAEYKAGRSATPTEFSGQIPLVHEVLDALKIRYIEAPGYEADDIIATLTTQATAEGMEVVIVSGDRDVFQLVADDVTMVYPVRGVSDVWRMDPAAVRSATSCRRSATATSRRWWASRPTTSPACRVGPKTAAKWITTYGDLSGIVANIDQIGGKVGDALREHLDGVLRNRRLNQLVRDVSLDVTVDELERQTWDREQVHEVFDSLEFRVLRERLFQTLDAVTAEAESGFDVDGDVLSSAEVPAWLDEHVKAGERTGVNVVGQWARGTGDVRALAVATAAGRAAYLDVTSLDEEADRAVADWLADPSRPKALHDAKGPSHALAARGWDLAGLTSDTALAAYLVKPDQRVFDLADLSLRMLHRELKNDTAPGGQGMLDFDGDQDAEAGEAMVVASAVLELADALDVELDRTGGTGLLRDVELPLVGVLAGMERSGIAVDVPALESLESDFDAQVREAQEDAWEAIDDRSINLGSPKQLQEVLFGRLNLPKTKRTKTGYTTDADALNELGRKVDNPFLASVLAFRDAARLRVTVEGLLKSVAEDQRVHTTYIQTIAATGRLSSTDPNLQNVPIRTEEGRRIREMFIVGDGFESLMSVDYSQIEMRVMAHLSGDEALIEAFRSGEDLHSFVGSKVFNVGVDEVTAAPAQQDQGDVLRPGLRAQRVRSVQAADHLDERGGRADGHVLRPVRRGARLPAASWSPRPGATATPRPCSAAAATCPTCSATTGSAARWPNGWRSTRRSRARPPTS